MLIKKVSALLFAAVAVVPFYSSVEIVSAASAKENCKIGYEWNRQTKKCEVKESSY